MSMTGVIRNLAVTAAALSMCLSPALASASVSSAPQTINPMVALSIFGSQASAAALCGSAVTTAASAAATAQAPAGGCVLPVVDAPPPLPVVEAAPLPPPSGFGITPILLGLAGIAILAALIISQDNDNDNENNPPVSP